MNSGFLKVLKISIVIYLGKLNGFLEAKLSQAKVRQGICNVVKYFSMFYCK